MKIFRTIGSFLITSLLAGCFVPRATTAGARGRVIDLVTKNSIEGASVSMKSQPKVFAKTARSGVFDLHPPTEWMVMLAPTCRQPLKDVLIIGKKGYLDKEIPIVETDNDKDLLIFLEPTNR